MKRSKACFITSIIIAVISLFCTACMAETEPEPVWPAFHADMMHNGRNPNSQDIDKPATLNPIWAFPRADTGPVDEDDATVDDYSKPTETTIPFYWDSGNWQKKTNEDAWESDEASPDYRYHELPAVPADYESYDKVNWNTGNIAKWKFPYGGAGRETVTKGYYRIWVWVPIAENGYSFTSKAIYTVHDDNGDTKIMFDQSAGGTWELLSDRQFSFRDSAIMDQYKVELTNVTGDSYSDIYDSDGNLLGNPVRVAADAVKFEKGTGLEIYSSPTSAIIKYDEARPKPTTLETGQQWYEAPTPVVYIGTIEQPLNNTSDAPDMGAVYCIDSVTPTNNPSITNDDGTYNNSSPYKKLSKNLGTPIWRYPDVKPENREPLEGPIEGGVYSSPTIAKDVTGRTVCYVAGMDRQVYALDAFDGSLIWKGPGMTVSEVGELATDVLADDVWDRVSSVNSFGNGYCLGTGEMSWAFDNRASTEEKAEGRAYSVYAWIPPVTTAGIAKYKIDYDGGSTTITINQANPGNQGKWVQLGSSYYNVFEVSVKPSDGAIVADAVMIVPDTIGAFCYASPVANISQSKCNSAFTDSASLIYAATATGRVLCFSACPKTTDDPQKLCALEWVYPDIRHKKDITGSEDAGEEPLGEIGATPAYAKLGLGSSITEALYVASLGGEIHCLDATSGKKKWIYMDSAGDDDFGAPMPRGGFTSSPCIDQTNGNLYIGSTEGYFYCLNAAANNLKGELKWRYPQSDKATPLGAFRFSTPVIGTAFDGTTTDESSAFDRVWIASANGRIYSFDARDSCPLPDGRRLCVTYKEDGTRKVSGIEYFEPNLLSPIQSSLAFNSFGTENKTTYKRNNDSGSGTTPKTLYNTMAMYVGDMEGKLNWYSADSGRSDWEEKSQKYTSYKIGGQIFSSPNITNFNINGSTDASYVYVATSSGLLVAFSDKGGAWGGNWAGGEWPFEGEINSNANKTVALAPDADIQCDIFASSDYPEFYKDSDSKNADQNADGTNPKEYRTPYDTTWSDNPWINWTSNDEKWIISPEMKVLNYSDNGIKYPADPTDQAAALIYNNQVEEGLRQEALKQRKYVIDGNDHPRQKGKPVYFEWGETINIFLWNLPPKNFLKGKNSGAITYSLTNGSSGSSAGSISATTRKFRLKEYTVLESQSGGRPTSAPFLQWLKDTDAGGTHSTVEYVKRCYAYLAVEIGYTGKQPPSPGPGWNLKVTVQTTNDASDKSFTTTVYPISRLTSADPPLPFVADEIYQVQDLGINNPLAIRDDQSATKKINGNPHTSVSIAWPPASTGRNYNYRTLQGTWVSRDQYDAHYNGNSQYDGTTEEFTTRMPVINLDYVNHGTSSREAWLGIIDRSAVGTRAKQNVISNFRVSAGELKWNGAEDAIKYSFPGNLGVKFPWEMGIGSADYPNIAGKSQTYLKATDGGNPASAKTNLPAVYKPGSSSTTFSYDEGTLQPETVFVSVEVPRFQPANISKGANQLSGYSKRVEAYVDSDNDGHWDSGDVAIGRPSVYQEAYRRFTVGVYVPPDPKIEVAEQTIDIGDAPHGLGIGLTADQEFSAYNPDPLISRWFKTVTIKNAGNVNLRDVYIGRNVRLFSDQVGDNFLIPANSITSSLNGLRTQGPFDQFSNPPFITDALGYTLTKARVGDPDPSVMTIPDKRKYDMNYGSAKTATISEINTLNSDYGMSLDTSKPLPVKVSVTVPLTQPIGSYRSYDTTYQTPYVPVFCDLNRNGGLDVGSEPVAEASFQLKANVRENQLTGGVTPRTLPQIDPSDTRVGDATPAAYRDLNTGNVYLYWSSNRLFDTSLTDLSEAEFANAPWFITRATLERNGTGWTLNGTEPNQQWWQLPGENQQLPSVQWPTLEGSGSDDRLMPWRPSMYSVRHHSPFITQRLTSNSVAPSKQTWLSWVGTADMQDADGSASVKKTTQEHMIMYRDITPTDDGLVPNSTDHYISHDPNMVKRYPSLAIYGTRAWMFWQGGNNNKWSIMYSTSEDLNSTNWSKDAVLKTPDCLSSVSGPNCIFRRFWGNIGASTPNYSIGKQFLDIAYAGTSKYDKAPDILLGRYLAKNETDVNDVSNTDADMKKLVSDSMPCNMAQPLPRVFEEKLQRDSQYGFYTSKHIAWCRPDPTSPVQDNWQGYSVGASDYLDLPFIHVVLPAGYTLPDGSVRSDVLVVSATDGSIKIGDDQGTDKWLVQRTTANLPKISMDEATGIYTYSYPDATTKDILGDMLVDFSAGVVRFTQPLSEVKTDDGFISPEVRADYTPRTWRLTADSAVDNSPRVFIERTNMNTTTNPGLSTWTSNNKPVDRMWVFWRKEGTGVKTSTIYYKTYRVGIDLAKLGKPAIPMNNNGTVSPVADIRVNNSLGPWEVNRAGTKIFFTEVDERYRSLLNSDSKPIIGSGPDDITISYKLSSNSSALDINADDIYWIEEVPEQSLLKDGNVNEGSIWAFADPVYSDDNGTLEAAISSKIWVFWTSTRGGTSDLFWETVSPNL